MRRLAKDQAALRKSLPPNYLFPDNEDSSALPDDLTQLIICLTGAEGTPYSHGLWKLSLRMPTDYPKNPPKATFKTRIYHPNVEEITGAVCLETLKRDWDPKLTLKDILITISCLLIQPNPDSALNAGAGALIQENYTAFARQAKLMTSIHAPIPKHLHAEVQEAKRRGEEPDKIEPVKEAPVDAEDLKENESQSMLPPTQPLSPRKSGSKRPLSELAVPDLDVEGTVSSSQGNIQNGRKSLNHDEHAGQPLRKSPKHKHTTQEVEACAPYVSIESIPSTGLDLPRMPVDAKSIQLGSTVEHTSKTAMPSLTRPGARPTLRKTSTNGSSKGKSLPRIGIRRL